MCSRAIKRLRLFFCLRLFKFNISVEEIKEININLCCKMFFLLLNHILYVFNEPEWDVSVLAFSLVAVFVCF